jgi:flotillin
MSQEQDDDLQRLLVKATPVCIGLALVVLAASRYKVAGPSERLVKTGIGVKSMVITQSTIHWPLQRVLSMNVQPWTVAVQINAKSRERIPFKLPLVVTVGPNTEDDAALRRFAEKLSQQQIDAVHSLVRDIVAGESR